jgi:DNA-binding MarR family transcriptional regulator
VPGADHVRRLLHRHELAATRLRSAMAKQHGMSEIEGLAIAQIAQHGELSQARLSELLDLSAGGTAALLQRLEQEDRVVRRQAAEDRRVRLISLSPGMAAKWSAFHGPLVADIEAALREAGAAPALIAAFAEALARAGEARADHAIRRHRRAAEPAIPFTPAIWG